MQENEAMIVNEEAEVYDEKGAKAELMSMSEVFSNSGMNEVLSSFAADDSPESKLYMHKLKTNTEDRLQNHLNEEIVMTGFIAHWVQTRNERTGELEMAPRMVIIDDQDHSYACVSVGVMNAMKTIVQDLWMPSKEQPIIIKPVRKQGKNRYEFTTIEVIGF